MITLGPVKDKKTVENLFNLNHLKFGEHSRCVAAKCGENTAGYCLFDMTSNKMTIKLIVPEDDVMLADGILRSTLHVGTERSIMDAVYENTVSEELLKRLDFIKDPNAKTINTDKLFEGCQSCKK